MPDDAAHACLGPGRRAGPRAVPDLDPPHFTLSLLEPGDRLTPLATFKLGPRENGNAVVHQPPRGG
jgi:hypothetical protein